MSSVTFCSLASCVSSYQWCISGNWPSQCFISGWCAHKTTCICLSANCGKSFS